MYAFSIPPTWKLCLVPIVEFYTNVDPFIPNPYQLYLVPSFHKTILEPEYVLLNGILVEKIKGPVNVVPDIGTLLFNCVCTSELIFTR